MAKGVLIVGESGSGKSTSIENLDPSSTFIINVKGKSLPFKGWKSKYSLFSSKDNPSGNYYTTDQASIVVGILNHISANMPHIKVVVLDDYQYISASEFMAKADQKGFDKFTSIGKNLYSTADLPSKLRDDLCIFYLNHAEVAQDLDGNRKLKAKTIGKLVDNVITLEGLFTIVLYTEVEKTKEGMKYMFLTQTDGSNTAKSPKGMFSSDKIPNDLATVVKAIEDYDN
jgi:hypothetical protein